MPRSSRASTSCTFRPSLLKLFELMNLTFGTLLRDLFSCRSEAGVFAEMLSAEISEVTDWLGLCCVSFLQSSLNCEAPNDEPRGPVIRRSSLSLSSGFRRNRRGLDRRRRHPGVLRRSHRHRDCPYALRAVALHSRSALGRRSLFH